jgi:hypothetical protein
MLAIHRLTLERSLKRFGITNTNCGTITFTIREIAKSRNATRQLIFCPQNKAQNQAMHLSRETRRFEVEDLLSRRGDRKR